MLRVAGMNKPYTPKAALPAMTALRALGRLPQGHQNKTEAAYEDRVLKPALNAGDIAWYRFEGIKLRLADNTFYTPDFAVLRRNGEIEIHEVKGARGIFMDDAKVKIKVAAAQYPFVFKIVYPRKSSQGGGWDIVDV